MDLPIDDPLTLKLTRCEDRIGYRFEDRVLLREALTHASGADNRLRSNERLEFLGDAILGMVVCETIYHQFPEYLEGDLTKIKSVVVSRQTCARISRELGLREFLILGKGIESSPEIPQSLLADVFESLVAGIHIDGGIQASADFIKRFIGNEIEQAVANRIGENHKSLLQQRSQGEFGATPVYRVIDEQGPDHNKCFRVSAEIKGNQYSPAWGKNKKQAEQRAASNALATLDGTEMRFADGDIPSKWDID